MVPGPMGPSHGGPTAVRVFESHFPIDVRRAAGCGAVGGHRGAICGVQLNPTNVSDKPHLDRAKTKCCGGLKLLVGLNNLLLFQSRSALTDRFRIGEEFPYPLLVRLDGHFTVEFHGFSSIKIPAAR